MSFYPLPTKDELRKQFVGKSLTDVAAPAAVIDLSKVKNNCTRMLEAVDQLGFGWRAHIKTHKTSELTRLQVGDGPGPVNIIVSTLIEAEQVTPLMLEYRSAGRAINLLYAFPVTPAAVQRLSAIAKALGPCGLSLMIDHHAQLLHVAEIHKLSGVLPCVFLKIDMGGHRAGVDPNSDACEQLIKGVLIIETCGFTQFLGLYSHAGHSYKSSSRAEALRYLNDELEALSNVAEDVRLHSPNHPLVLSVGATPTSTAVRNLLVPEDDLSYEEDLAITALAMVIREIREVNGSIEIHAGVYPTLDLQQLSTHALSTSGPSAMLSWDDMALTILAEVASLYPSRGKQGTHEALVGAGSLALGREPCKAYDGWGILSPWNRKGVGAEMPKSSGPEGYDGWYVGRISQEHGIMVCPREGRGEELEIGQKVRIWPNHACIAGAGFGWYLVIDSGLEGRTDEIVDVWPRWRGW